MLSSITTAQANAALIGVCAGTAYYVLARAMEVAALRLRGQSMVGAMLLGFVVRLVLAAAVLAVLIFFTQLHAVALSLGFLTAYTVILGWETLRHARRPLGRSRLALHGRE